MAIDLTHEEKRTLYQFLLLYLGSAFTLFAIIAYLFYQLESNFFYATTQHEMEQKASRLSASIIHAHMANHDFSFKEAAQDNRYVISFYTKEKHPIIDNSITPINFSQKFTLNNENAIFVDQSTFGHLSVEYIVIQKKGIANYIKALQQKILLTLLISYILITLIGYLLAKLFIKPIQLKRLSLDNFITDSTHELNTPITALMLSINAPNFDSSKNRERIKLSAKRIADIYNDLTYLILRNTPKESHQKPLLLNELLEKELNYLTLLAEKRKVTIQVKEQQKLYFPMDQESFIRLIHNLIINAIKYNQIGGSVSITFDTNTLIIEDTGIGISKSHQKEIYQRFFRATTQTGGFGLGLNIVDKICKTYGIKVEVESELNRGTKFTLSFSKT